jgi:hypothetical protein
VRRERRDAARWRPAVRRDSCEVVFAYDVDKGSAARTPVGRRSLRHERPSSPTGFEKGDVLEVARSRPLLSNRSLAHGRF